jgi:hypothetical protein
MKTTAREFLAKAALCEMRAKKARGASDREWELILARAYRILAETESEAAARRQEKAA